MDKPMSGMAWKGQSEEAVGVEVGVGIKLKQLLLCKPLGLQM